MYGPLISAIVFALLFIYVELKVAPEPILAPFLLKEKIPMLVGISNFLVATCNFTIMYNFPTWFQTVLLTSASEAGAYNCGMLASVRQLTILDRCTSNPERDLDLCRLALRRVCIPNNPVLIHSSCPTIQMGHASHGEV